jgi:hypothetical protein
MAAFSNVPGIRRSAALAVLPTLALCLLTACGGHKGGPPFANTDNSQVDYDSTGNPLYQPTHVLVTGFSPVSGPALGSIAVTGSGFTTASLITIDQVNVSTFSIDSDNLITVQVPNDAATGTIEVSTTMWGKVMSTGTFTVVPQITAITPDSGPVGTVVSLTGSGFIGTTRVTIGDEKTTGPGSAFSSPTNANQITVTVGYDATTGPILLTASGLVATGPTFTVTN